MTNNYLLLKSSKYTLSTNDIKNFKVDTLKKFKLVK